MTTTPTNPRALPDPGAWPGLARPRRSPARAAIARQLFRRAVRTLPVRVHMPDGEVLGLGGPTMRIVHPEDFFTRVGSETMIGFGEAYLAGDWTAEDDLADVLTPFARRLSRLIPPALQTLRRFVDPRKPATERNTVDGARHNIHRHYDLSNELFALFLDETMTYSSAWFADQDQNLADAQLRKIDGVLDHAGVREGSRVLEIGTGWGSAAIRAAQRGAHVTSITISAEQQRLARERVAAAGVADRVSVELCDYRDAQGRYDSVISVEMIEAVGIEYWPTYFAAVNRLLVPGGRFGLQAITMPHDRMLATANSYTWIHKYVFPGGNCLSVPAIEQNVAASTTMRIDDRRSLGDDYAHTLRLWRTRFLDAWDDVRALGFDETFRRMWEFYLAYSEAGFRSAYLDVWQFGMVKA